MAGFETTTGYPLPQLGLTISNRLRFVMVDHASGRVIDYVQLDGMGGQRSLTSAGELEGNDDWGHGGVWDTNRIPAGSASENSHDVGNQKTKFGLPGIAAVHCARIRQSHHRE